MTRRRAVLGLCASLVVTGGVNGRSDSADPSPTGTGGGDHGNPAPWGADSEMDVGVENDTDGDLLGAVAMGVDREEFTALRSGSVWVSGEVIDDSATPTVRLTLDDGRETAVEWEAEQQNQGYLLFEIGTKEITDTVPTRSSIERTQVTESETG